MDLAMAILPMSKILLKRWPKKKPKILKEPQAATSNVQPVHPHHPFPENELDQQALKKRRKECVKVQLSDVAGLNSSSLQVQNDGASAECHFGDAPRPEDEQENQSPTEEQRTLSHPNSSTSDRNDKGVKRKQQAELLGRKSKRKANDGKSQIFEDSQHMQRRPPIEIRPNQNGPPRGMKKWLADYHSRRPGFHVLQQQIDDFIANFEAQEEKARTKREAAAAEEGWTVVQHHKGRKKTADLDTGIRVGGVAPAAVEKKLKGKKDIVLDFYRFQRREARRNELLELQQRFEEDKKKIAALRAARKFRPY